MLLHYEREDGMRTHRPATFDKADAPLFAELNTTPLIDVMLVLLVMLILVVPAMTHKIRIDLPQGPSHYSFEPKVYELNLDATGRLHWNGALIDEASLPSRLAAVRKDLAGELHLSADGAVRYEVYDRILGHIKHARVTRLGLIGNDRFARDLDR
jgi:biopolymer transport protein ExbD